MKKSSISKIGLYAGLSASVVSLFGTFENFTNLHLIWRILITGIAGILICLAVTNILIQWSKPQQSMPGYGRPAPSASNFHLCLSTVVLSVLSAVFVYLAWLQTDRFVLKVEKSQFGGSSIALFFAPSRMVETMTVQLPGPERSDCNWSELRTDSLPRLRAQTIDWDSPIRKLRIDDFVHPQAVRIECRAPADLLRGALVEPPSTDLFLTSKLNKWQITIYLLGVFLWVFSIERLWRLSQ